MKATLAIRRGTPQDELRVESFLIEFESGQSILDGLRLLRRDQDPTLAFRFACINANACKECMMLIDGEVDYACTVRLKEGTTELAPLPKKALVRDLVTEIAPPDERLERSIRSVEK
ncbi:MAG TPA: 2Fe-2S iron-sulfur cluster-binding protein [Bradyrhizobium sp.]|jgi:succinate dehydrogenase/fumarate reductase-like Fe-S protein|nr:2Fe-2S iron-sulfur cluster-binding protein [Bradyrhizobium sp.]